MEIHCCRIARIINACLKNTSSNAGFMNWRDYIGYLVREFRLKIEKLPKEKKEHLQMPNASGVTPA